MIIPKIVQEVPPAPAGVEAWLRKEVFKGRFVIYDTKTQTGTCTYCGEEQRIERGIKHNHKGICNRCGEDIVYKKESLGRKSLAEYARVLVFVKKGKSVYGVLSEVIMSYEGEKPEISRAIEAVYKFNRKEQEYQCFVENWYHENYWEQRKRIAIPGRWGLFGPHSAETIYYPHNLGTVFRGTDLKYCQIDKQQKEMNFNAHGLLDLVHLNAKYDSIEKLYKVGLSKLIDNKVTGDGISRALYLRGRDLRKILGLNREEIKEAIEMNIDMRTLFNFKDFRKKGRKLTLKQASEIQHIGYVEDRLLQITEHVSYDRMMKYLEQQQERNQENSKRYNSFYTLTQDYNDYLKECEKLEFDLTDKRILFPKDLIKAHERTSIQVKVKASEVEDAQIRKYASQLMKLAYESGKYLIRPATTAEEIILEGKKQSHCVGGYLPRIAKGETSILLVRRKEAPEEPFYTMEYKNGQIIQCRGKSNCNTTEEVQAFIEEWLAWTKKKKKSKVA